MRNKRGWIHILEATIAVMIVAGVMMTVYSDQSVRVGLPISDYSYSLQNEILEGITINSNLRMDVLSVGVDDYSDPYFRILDSIVAAEVPYPFNHLLRVCNLGDPNDACKMTDIVFTATLDKDVFVEDTVISYEIEDENTVFHDPKKVRLFLWEGEVSEENCYDECEAGSDMACSLGARGIVTNVCEDVDGDDCLERNVVSEECSGDEVCVDNGDSVGCVASVCSDTCSEDLFCSGGDVWKATCASSGDCLNIESTDVVEDCGERGCFDGVCGKGSQTCEKKVNIYERCVTVQDALDSCIGSGYDYGEFVAGDCEAGTRMVNCWDIEEGDTCSVDRKECSASGSVITLPCIDGCFDNSAASEESCGMFGFCLNGGCLNTGNNGWRSVCEKKEVVEVGCAIGLDDQCDAYDEGEVVDSCGISLVMFACSNIVEEVSSCGKSVPDCPNEYTFVRQEACVV